MTAFFTIAHLTDAHLPAHGGFKMRELLGKRALSALNWQRSRRKQHVQSVADALQGDVIALAPDHVAMTGDVTNFGLPREFIAGARWLHRFGAPEHVSFVPGNHEAIMPGVTTERDATFAPFASNDEGAAAWPWLRRRGPVSLIGISTSIATPPFFAQGAAGPAQIAQLREILRKEKGRVRVILIHHPPTDLSKPRKSLRDRASLVDVLAAEGAELVLHGHNHRNELSWIDGMAGRIPVLGAPSASTPLRAGRAAAEWRLITIETGEKGSEHHQKDRSPARISMRRRGLQQDGRFADIGRFGLIMPSPAPG